MKLHLYKGIFIQRYKRFFADILLTSPNVISSNMELRSTLEGNQMSPSERSASFHPVAHQAHVANTGSLKTCLFSNIPCLYSKSNDPNRKLKYSLHALKDQESQTWIGIDTSWPSHLILEAFKNQKIPHWDEFDEIHPEIKINKKTRLDFLLTSKKNRERKHYIEVKNVTMASGDKKNSLGNASFPDAITERGQKHLDELIILNRPDLGVTSEIFFVIQRSDCNSFSPSRMIDPQYATKLELAKSNRVRITAYDVLFQELMLPISQENFKDHSPLNQPAEEAIGLRVELHKPIPIIL